MAESLTDCKYPWFLISFIVLTLLDYTGLIILKSVTVNQMHVSQSSCLARVSTLRCFC